MVLTSLGGDRKLSLCDVLGGFMWRDPVTSALVWDGPCLFPSEGMHVEGREDTLSSSAPRERAERTPAGQTQENSVLLAAQQARAQVGSRTPRVTARCWHLWLLMDLSCLIRHLATVTLAEFFLYKYHVQSN